MQRVLNSIGKIYLSRRLPLWERRKRYLPSQCHFFPRFQPHYIHIGADTGKGSDRQRLLPAATLLRTVHASLPAHGSSLLRRPIT